MLPPRSAISTLTLAAVLASGCTVTGRDGKGDSFLNDKADERFTACQLIESVNFIRESTTTRKVLTDDVGLHPDTADAILDHIAGPNGTRGDADDNLIENLTELDSVDFVGTIALDLIVGAILDRCEIDLGTPGDKKTASRPYINADTFKGTSGGGFTRDAIEMEATYAVHGLTTPQLNTVLAEKNSRGRTRFRRIVNDLEDVFGALTLGDSPLESNWNSQSNDLREALKFVALTIEPGRKEADVQDETFKAGTGQDTYEDHYFSTFNMALQKNGVLIRARKRVDGDPEDLDDPCKTPMRRLLVQTKFSPEIGADGVKRGAKIDTRTEANTLCDDKANGVIGVTQWGESNWTGSVAPLEPIRAAYDVLKEAGALLTIGPFPDVLLLNPTAALWSIRNRFHYDQARKSSVDNWFRNGIAAIERIKAECEDALGRTGLTAGDRAALRSVIEAADGLLDGSTVLAAAKQMDSRITAIEFPDTWNNAADRAELDRNELIAAAFDQEFGLFDDLVDDSDIADIVSGADDVGDKDLTREYSTYVRMTKTGLRNHRAAVSFYNQWKTDNANHTESIAKFVAHCKAQTDDLADVFEDCKNVLVREWNDLGKQLRRDMITHSRRMVEAAGAVANSLWFTQFRSFYFGNVSEFGNFMIVTFDWTQAVSERVWDTLTMNERYQGIPGEHIFFATLVQENQVELTADGPVQVVDTKAMLQPKIDDGSATAEEIERFEAASRILDIYLAAETALAEASRSTIVNELEDQTGVQGLRWEPAVGAKGEQALRAMTIDNLE